MLDLKDVVGTEQRGRKLLRTEKKKWKIKSHAKKTKVENSVDST